MELRKTGIGGAGDRYGWTGGSGCTVYADPTADAVDILLTQRYLDGPALPPDMQDLATAAYAAFAGEDD